jgi:hypothetical protein
VIEDGTPVSLTLTSMKISAASFKILASFGMGISLLSCQKDHCPEPDSTKGDYYPTTIGSRWNYEYTWFSQPDHATYHQILEALKDTLYEGKRYT